MYKKSDVENLKKIFLIHGLLYNKYLSEKKEYKSGITELILLKEGQIYPHPIGFMRNSIKKSSGMTISVALMMPLYLYMKQFSIKMLKKQEKTH